MRRRTPAIDRATDQPADAVAGPIADRPAGALRDRSAHAVADRVPALDGVRGLAILAVLAFHTGAAWASGGSVGVDVFFVLSGFLITSLLLAERAGSGTIRLRWFYARRALRLLPALVVMLAAAAIYSTVAPHPVGTSGLRAGILGSLFYVSDFQAATGHVPVLGLVEHTWSLSIEEHFYLIWPLLMIVALRSGGMRRLVGVAVGVTVVSAVLPVLLWRGADSIPRLYYAPDTRAVQLLVGCLLALALQAAPLRRRIERWSRWCAPAALIALLAFVVFGSWRSPGTYLGGMTAVALLAAAVVASAATSSPGRPAGSGPVARLLSFVPLVALGRISYGLYLWHWPVYLVLNGAFLQMSFWPTQLVRVAVSVALAIASYGVVERPFLRLQRLVRPSTRPQVLVAPKQLVAPNP